MTRSWISPNQTTYSHWLAARLPRALSEFPARYPFLWLCVTVVALLGAFMLLEFVVSNVASLPAERYGQAVLSIALVQEAGVVLSLLAIAATVLLTRYGMLFAPWQVLENSGVLRSSILIIAAFLAWPLVTIGYNHYHDQPFYFDRLLLVTLVVLIWWRPIWVLPFVFIAFAFLWQTMEPTLGNASHIPHKRQLLLVLIMFGSSFLLFAMTGIRSTATFWFMTCCLVAAVYWEPGWGKLQIDWLDYRHLYHMPLAAYAHGWLAFLETDSVVSFAKSLAPFDTVLRWFVITIEIGALFFMAHRMVAVTLLVLVSIFHVGVFVLYGYLFWTWVLLNIVVMLVLFRDRKTRSIRIFTPGHLVLSMLLIAFANKWCEPPKLAWLDSRLSYTFRFTGVGESGREYEIHSSFFGPHEDVFTMSNFSYLVNEHRALVSPYGITDPKRYEALNPVRTAPEVYELEAEIGRDRFDEGRKEVFYDFVRKFVEHRNENAESAAWLTMLSPPRQFWSFSRGPRGAVYEGQEPLREIRISEVTTLFDERELQEIRTIDLESVNIF